MTHTVVTPFNYAAWGASFAGELIVLWCLRGHQRFPSVRAARFYLFFQILSSLVIAVCVRLLSVHGYNLFYRAYMIALYAAEVQVIIGLFRDMVEGDARPWGSIRSWVAAACFIGLACAAVGFSHPHPGVPIYLATMGAIRQISGFVQCSILISLFVFGFLMCSSWHRSTAFIHLGVGVMVGSDFLCNQLAIKNPSWEPILRHGPDLAFLLTLLLWSSAVLQHDTLAHHVYVPDEPSGALL